MRPLWHFQLLFAVMVVCVFVFVAVLILASFADSRYLPEWLPFVGGVSLWITFIGWQIGRQWYEELPE